MSGTDDDIPAEPIAVGDGKVEPETRPHRKGSNTLLIEGKDRELKKAEEDEDEAKQEARAARTEALDAWKARAVSAEKLNRLLIGSFVFLFVITLGAALGLQKFGGKLPFGMGEVSWEGADEVANDEAAP